MHPGSGFKSFTFQASRVIAAVEKIPIRKKLLKQELVPVKNAYPNQTTHSPWEQLILIILNCCIMPLPNIDSDSSTFKSYKSTGHDIKDLYCIIEIPRYVLTSQLSSAVNLELHHLHCCYRYRLYALVENHAPGLLF